MNGKSSRQWTRRASDVKGFLLSPAQCGREIALKGFRPTNLPTMQVARARPEKRASSRSCGTLWLADGSKLLAYQPMGSLGGRRPDPVAALSCHTQTYSRQLSGTTANQNPRLFVHDMTPPFRSEALRGVKSLLLP